MANKATFAEMARLAALGKMVEELVRGERKGRGRPPKAAGEAQPVDPNAPPKKKRGRPKKVKAVEAGEYVPPTEWPESMADADAPADSEV